MDDGLFLEHSERMRSTRNFTPLVAATSLWLASTSPPVNAAGHAKASAQVGLGTSGHGLGPIYGGATAGLIFDIEAGMDWALDLRGSAILGIHRAPRCSEDDESCQWDELTHAFLPTTTLSGQAAWPARLPRSWTLGPAATVRVAKRGDREVYCAGSGTCSTANNESGFFWPTPGIGLASSWRGREVGTHAFEAFLGVEYWSPSDYVFPGPQVLLAWRWPSGFRLSARANSVEGLLAAGWEWGARKSS